VTSAGAPADTALEWKGPFIWSSGGSDSLFSCDYAQASGVYLMTAPWNDGYLGWSAGITARPFAQRFWEHTKEFLSGTYDVLDADALVKAQRVMVWHGLWYKNDRFRRLDEFLVRYAEIAPYAVRLLNTLRIFVAPADCKQRLLERIEAAVMSALYSAGPPIDQIPDRGMRLCPRRANEMPVLVANRAAVTLHGIPQVFEV